MKRQIVLLSFLASFAATLCLAQQPRRVTEKFFPDPDVEIATPLFAKRGGYTNYKELMAFLDEQAAAHPGLLRLEVAGQTQKGRDIPLVTVSTGAGDKLRVFYTARVHGDEPGGTEAMLHLIRQLAVDEGLRPLLDRADFYIMPMVNIDGAESSTRATANGIDLNRDQTRLASPEARVLQATLLRVQPHLAVDFHEYQPTRSDFNLLSSDVISTPWDVMFLYSSNPNVPAALRGLVKDLFIANAAAEMDLKGLTHHTYYTSSNEYGQIQFNVGGSSPRSTSNIFALKNCVSMLMETRGVKLDRVSIKRRVYTAYSLAVSFATSACDNARRVREVLGQAAADRGDVAVKFTSAKTELPFVFIDMLKNELVTFNAPARIAEQFKVGLSRPLPRAYYLLPTAAGAAEKLVQHGVVVDTLAVETAVEVEAYTAVELKESPEQIGGSVYPLTIATKLANKSVTFPAGSFRISTDQRYARVIGVLLEPESANGFVNYRVLKVAKNEELPIYREK